MDFRALVRLERCADILIQVLKTMIQIAASCI